MAFGKKDNSNEAVPDAAIEAAPGAAEPIDDASAGPVPETIAPPEAGAPEPAPTDSVDALLSVFQTTQAEAEDNTVLLEAAGDVAIEDLLDQLHTVAAALGIDTTGVMDFGDEELLAA